MFTGGKLWKIVLGACLLIMLIVGLSLAPAVNQKPQISIDYFYINACGSCDTEGEFKLIYDGIIGSLDDNVDSKLDMHNTFHHTDAVLLEQYYEKYQVPEDQQQVPILFINGTCLSGMDAIQGNLRSEFIMASQSASVPSVQIPKPNTIEGNKDYSVRRNSSNDSVLLYFYLPSCSSCDNAAQSLGKLKNTYTIDIDGAPVNSRVVLKKFNAGDASNMQLLKDYFTAYKVPEDDQKVPVIFAGSTWFSGDESIEDRIHSFVADGSAIGTVELVPGDNLKDVDNSPLSDYSVLGILAAGLVNGLNPCSLAIVLFLLSLLATKNINILRAGICFVAGKFIMFFLLGTLLYQVFLKADIHWFNLVTKIILVTLSVILVALNIHDMFAARGERYGRIRLQLPEKLRRINHKMIKTLANVDRESVFLPMSFIVGMLIAAGEFLCTGQIYLATIVLVLQTNPVSDFRALSYFLMYGLAFILPLMIIIVIVHKGKALFEVSEAVRAKMPLIKLINTVVFLLFSLVVILLF